MLNNIKADNDSKRHSDYIASLVPGDGFGDSLKRLHNILQFTTKTLPGQQAPSGNSYEDGIIYDFKFGEEHD